MATVALTSPQPTDTLPPSPATVVQDDFFLAQGIWSDCAYCTFRDGAFVFGPSPVSGIFLQELSICGSCGEPITYRMRVDAAYGEGETEPERGFGLLLGWAEDHVLIVEISPSQSIDVWRL